MKKILLIGGVALAALLLIAAIVRITKSPNQTTQMNTNDVQFEITQEGTGATAQNGNLITVHYTGRLMDGTVFDSSIPKGRPFSFTLGNRDVIAGWDQGILGMRVGEKRKLTIAPELGYGPSGYGPIPPNATLIFDVELLSIQKP